MMIELTFATVRTMPLGFVPQVPAMPPSTATREHAPGTSLLQRLEGVFVATTLALLLCLGVAVVGEAVAPEVRTAARR